ncbi:MAG: lytic murein transglycosylase [Beijerinckiaceae bacterium]
MRAIVLLTGLAIAIAVAGYRPAQAAGTQAMSANAGRIELAQVDLRPKSRPPAKTTRAKKGASSKKSADAARRTSPRNDASQAKFRAYIEALWPQARAMGVSRQVFDNAFRGMTLNTSVLRPHKAQAEFVKPIWSYINGSVNPRRISQGREHARRWNDTLANIEQRYGVDRYVVLAIWGMETSYGGFTGNQSVIRALASLAYAGVREEFFRKELLTALLILQQGHVSPGGMTGSWAGAMGQTQFMPTSFVKYAVDYDGDGHKNIWTNVSDALASTANYLAKFGWRRGLTWGYEIVLPGNFDFAAHDPRQERPFSYWSSIGVRRADGRAMPSAGAAAILLPAGRRGPVFLMTPNFKVIKEYNRSNAYALGVAHLSDRIAGAGPLRASWPLKDRPLSTRQVMEMQRYLNRNGFNAGKVDGKVGENVTVAIRAFQKSRGMVADGYPTAGLLQAMRKAR